KFVSNSGRVVTDQKSWIFYYKAFLRKGSLPVGFEVKWSAVSLATDEYRPKPVTDKTRESATTLVQGMANAKHVLRLEPIGDNPVKLSGFRVYRPLVK
ncbi:MAG: SGNH/GDSL hydrolase family protein, partial [Victivallales bacterium]|nr:SGNH/GDSL hydrolase family protein [Victivallales bacterium]